MHIISHFVAQTFGGIFKFLRKLLPILLEAAPKSGMTNKKIKNARPLRGVIKCDIFASKNSAVCVRIGFLVATVKITGTLNAKKV
jgi:hypothetical protein